MKRSSRNDLTTDEILRFRKLEQTFLSRCRQFGYREIKTGTIQPLYIFTAPGVMNESKLRRIYSFIDWDGWSGERVALKPDSTTCVARFYGERMISSEPRQKICYVENHFEWADSWDDISERWQFGVENIGSERPESDIEVIFMAIDILQEVGLKDIYVYLSYPYIIREMIKHFGLDEKTEARLISGIKERSEAVVSEILNSLHCKDQEKNTIERLMALSAQEAEYKVTYLENLKTGMQIPAFDPIRSAFENFISICRWLDNLNCRYIIDFSMLGDLEYYTGIEFQILSTPVRKSKKDILCSGGRYDSLIKKMWKLEHNVPAVGFALFARNLFGYVPASIDRLQNIYIHIGSITSRNVKTGQILCDKLTKIGFCAQIAFIPIEPQRYESFGLVIKVDHKIYPDGYEILYSQQIDKPLLINLFGELNV